jgi:Flp pilus assembly protein TadB
MVAMTGMDRMINLDLMFINFCILVYVALHLVPFVYRAFAIIAKVLVLTLALQNYDRTHKLERTGSELHFLD